MINGVPVQLPETSKAPEVGKGVLPITVKADGTVYLDKLVVRGDEVASQLQRLHATEGARPVAVRGDKRALYGAVAEVLAAARDAGWRDVSLVSVERRTISAAPQAASMISGGNTGKR
ncbi:MAG TPA: biopolymer transporter ExbD, partial [Thermoanaerobaculia bacterium]|nr:biopolymer transporter ExbD [Thermoanaerobaculia bacterium]